MTIPGHRAPYSGSDKKLVISIDIGTTFSAASFCLLKPKEVPKFESVLRWSKQATPDTKIPSAIYYDKTGNARAFGAETDDQNVIVKADVEKWIKIECWKLHLRPNHLHIIPGLKNAISALPENVSIDKIFTDFLRYIKEQDLKSTMIIILTTPNGWEGPQQSRMRSAAISAGLVDPDGGRRVRFVTEAEAAVLYAADSGNIQDWIVLNGHLILCDCGGGTVDVTGYKITSIKPTLRLEESAASHCYLAGGVSVTNKARVFLENHLRGTEYDSEEHLQVAVNDFEQNAKKKFEAGDAVSYVYLGGFKSIESLGITRGRLRITQAEMISFFENLVRQIEEGLGVVYENGDRRADKIILVGGFASSPYVYSQLVAWGRLFNISVSKPDGPAVKAVSHGALVWYLDSTVGARMAKYYYGTDVQTPYDESNPEHIEYSSHKVFDEEHSDWRIMNVWAGIVSKNEKIKTKQDFSTQFTMRFKEDTTSFKISETIYAYRRSVPPTFLTFPGKETLQPGFDIICKVQGDLQDCFLAAPLIKTASGSRVREVNFEICLRLGEPEITARLRWLDRGEWIYGPANVVYD